MAEKAKKANELDRLKSKVTGQKTKSGYGSRRNDRAEFSDNDLISDDDQDEIPQDGETRPGKESSVPNTRTIHGRGPLSGDNAGPTSSRDVLNKRKGGEIDEITGPRKKPPEKIPPKSLTEQIFTRVFLSQVLICVTCSFIVSCLLVYLLPSSLHVSDPRDYSYRSCDKGFDIDIESKVRKAIDTELDKANVYQKVQKAINETLDMTTVEMDIEEHIHDKLNKVDIDGRVNASVERHVPKVARREAQSAIREPEIIDFIKTEASEKSVSMDKKFQGELSRRVEPLENAVDGIKNIEESITSFKEKLRKLETDVSKMFDNFKTTSSTLDKLNESNMALSNTMEHYSNEISDLQNTIAEADARLKEMNDEKENLMHALSEANALKEEYKSKLENFSKKLETIQHNVFNKDSFIIAFMLLIVIVLVLTMCVYNLYQRQNKSMPWPTALPHEPGNQKILKQIPERPVLHSGVCIISFDEQRMTTHQRLLESANILNCEVKVHVIRRHEQIPQLPRCKVYLMCTEFSERHVIIEEQGKGLGDLHRTTYYAVMKMGGCLIILYTRDPGSRNLKDQSLYNTKIYCVKNQPELSVLQQDGRFFSTYDNLTPFQRDKLRKKITVDV